MASFKKKSMRIQLFQLKYIFVSTLVNESSCIPSETCWSRPGRELACFLGDDSPIGRLPEHVLS